MNRWYKFTSEITSVLLKPTVYLKRDALKKVSETYEKELVILVSFSLELNKLTLHPKYNSDSTTINFEEEMGKLLYYFLEDNRELFNREYKALPKQSQLLAYYLFSVNWSAKVGGDSYLLDIVPTVLKVPELVAMVNFPKPINRKEFSLQGLSRKKQSSLEFPVYISKLPYKLNRRTRLVYITSAEGKLVSNSVSNKVKVALSRAIKHLDFGFIGVEGPMRGYKTKKQITPLVITKNPKEATDLYSGNRLDKFNKNFIATKGMFYSYNDIDMKFGTVKEVSNVEEFKDFMKKSLKTSCVIISKNGIDYLSPDIEYKKVPVVDYIVDEAYEAVGLVVNYNGEYIRLMMNVPKELVDDGIKGRFVRIKIIKYMGEVMAVTYNRTERKWSVEYAACSECGGIGYVHKTKGLCTRCYNFWDKLVDKKIDKSFTEDVSVFKDFEIQVKDYNIVGKVGQGIVATRILEGLGGLQKPLPLDFDGTILDTRNSVKNPK